MTNEIICIDHKGIEYTSVSAMCKAYNIGRTTYQQRLKKGIGNTTFLRRIDDGWSLKDALTQNVSSITKTVQDHLGNKYPSIQAMITAYGLNVSTYNTRKKHGWSLEEILTTPIKDNIEYLGNTVQMNNGLYATVIEKYKAKIRRGSLYTVRFEDGNEVKNIRGDNIKIGSVKHPTISSKGTGTIIGIKVHSPLKNKDKVYYKCECPICGWKNIATPQQIIGHAKTHKPQEETDD